ncbi:hypothetical protein ACH518_03420 [Methylomonas sp. HW2-6]|uniref:hypothetical protein n=1 Tax=Methylomonas sp. HW2-6 TaxID=3376687 RepID=UPI0040417692
MDWLTFASSVVGSLAWPVATVVLVLLIRKPLGTLLPTLRNLKYKDLELDFGKELRKAEEKANQILPAANKPTLISKPKSERDSNQIINESKRLFEEFPEPAVALAWTAVEVELMDAILRTASSPDYPPHNSALKNAIHLKDAGYIGDDKIDLVKRMTNLRNIAVHGHGGGPVTVEDAREFIALTEWLVKDLKEIKR